MSLEIARYPRPNLTSTRRGERVLASKGGKEGDGKTPGTTPQGLPEVPAPDTGIPIRPGQGGISPRPEPGEERSIVFPWKEDPKPKKK